MILCTCGRSNFPITFAARYRPHAVIRISQERLSRRRFQNMIVSYSRVEGLDFYSWKQYCLRQSLLFSLTITTTSSSRCSKSAPFKKSSHSRPFSFMLPAIFSLFPSLKVPRPFAHFFIPLQASSSLEQSQVLPQVLLQRVFLPVITVPIL